jgi:hypothetical protein
MATFIKLRIDNSNEIVHVNMDHVILMERYGDSYTSLLFVENKVRPVVTVRETPEEIIRVMSS